VDERGAGDSQKALAFIQRLVHQAQIAVFEVAQAAMNQASRKARRATTRVALVEQQDF
jgi:hypothetical protein